MFTERIHAHEKETHFVQRMMGTKSTCDCGSAAPTPKETLPLLLFTPPCPSSHPSVCWAYKCSGCWTAFPQIMNGLSWVTAVDSVPRVTLAWKIQAKKWPAFSLVWGLRPWTCDPKNCYNLSDVTRILENLPTISLLFITFSWGPCLYSPSRLKNFFNVFCYHALREWWTEKIWRDAWLDIANTSFTSLLTQKQQFIFFIL